MSVNYSITFTNHSGNNGDFCLFQTLPTEMPNLMSLAWQAKRCNNKTVLDIDWNINYSATWSQTGTLTPGVRYRASENYDVDITDPAKNSVQLTMYEGAYMFTNPSKHAPKGNIGIYTEGEIPNNDVSVGVAMGGKSAFAMMARPNWNLLLSPHPVYWAVFGTFKEGEVLDVTSMSNIIKLDFPINKYHLDVLLDEGNNWTVTDLLTSNKIFRESLVQK